MKRLMELLAFYVAPHLPSAEARRMFAPGIPIETLGKGGATSKRPDESSTKFVEPQAMHLLRTTN